VSDLIAPEVVAKQFGEGTTRRKVIDWAHRYGWPHVRVGRTIAFTPEQFEQIIAQHSVSGTKEHLPNRMPGQTAMSAARAS
jgi:hypothetical protein